MARIRFVPEAIIVYLLKHSQAFDWACINCQCKATRRNCAGKWQSAQGEVGLDFVAQTRPNDTSIGPALHGDTSRLVLEAKGDRVNRKEGQVTGINRPAYNEMVGSLCSFLVANFDRIVEASNKDLYGWLYTTTFLKIKLAAFTRARANLPSLLPSGRRFVLGVFDVDAFWDTAPSELQRLATDLLIGPEPIRNSLIATQMSSKSSGVDEQLISVLFKFEIIYGSNTGSAATAGRTTTIMTVSP